MGAEEPGSPVAAGTAGAAEPGGVLTSVAPVARERAKDLARTTMALFPVRVWRHFLQHNGFVLAAGVSYQALFAFFAALYVAFSAVGIWLGGSTTAVDGLITLLNDYVPGLIETDSAPGLIAHEQLESIAFAGTGVLAVTGAIALLTAIWTAIGFVTFVRRAVRDIFGLDYDNRSYVLLKLRDLLAAVIFGAALIVGSALTAVGTWSLRTLFTVFGWDTSSALFNGGVRTASIVVSFILSAAALGALFRFLTGTSLHWRTVWPGALVGSAGITLLQLGAGLLVVYTPSNPLLATFGLFVGLMLWFRLVGIVMLVAAAWIAVTAKDEDIPLAPLTPEERAFEEHRVLTVAAQVRLRDAQAAVAEAHWWETWAAKRAVARAEAEVAHLLSTAPPEQKGRWSFE